MREYDVVVVGGGIHGAGVAQAAAARGHTVLVLEQKGELAGGTSGRSSKLIHGGLRYLETGHFAMVAECLRERARLLRLAPDLVHLRWFHFPIYRATGRRPWQIRIALSLYALLGLPARAGGFATVPRGRWDELDGLMTEGLQVVFRYRDAQTDDALLTRAVMRSAEQMGATLALSSALASAELEERGCTVEFLHDGLPQGCRARVLVNAAGPWAGEVLKRVRPHLPIRDVELIQGAHILVRGQLRRGIYYVEAPQDGRAVFVMPWRGNTLVGTTETRYDGDPDQVHPLAEEKTYLAATLDHYFPRYGACEPAGILDSFAGLRVLPAGRGRYFHRPREAYLDVDRTPHPRVLTIWGGKLTTYRATAEKVMRRIAAALPRRAPVADTRTLPLSAR